MRTPREILLGKHEAAQPKLDAIRREVLRGTRPAEPEPPGLVTWVDTLWQQLVLPCGRAWGGLAAAWLVILLLRFWSSDQPPAPAVAAPQPSVMTQALLNEQRLLRAELLGLRAHEPEAPAGPSSPHSQVLPGGPAALRQADFESVPTTLT
jgi:hypothetical protein